MSNKNVRRGAQPIKPKKPPKRIAWGAVPWRSMLVMSLLGTLLYALYLGQQRWLIKDVLVQGQLHFLNHKQVAKELLWLRQSNFFSVDLDKVKQQIMQLPLVSDVRVRRVWPASIKVAILEARPLAILNGDKLLASDGKLSALPAVPLPELSNVAGSERYADYATEMYPLVQKNLASHALSIQVLQVSALGALSVKLHQGGRIYFGRKQLTQRLTRLDKLLKQIDIRQIQSIDLRYHKGAAIHWQAQENKS